MRHLIKRFQEATHRLRVLIKQRNGKSGAGYFKKQKSYSANCSP